MDVKVWTAPAPAGAASGPITPQPDVARVQKDDEISFSGTLVSYDPSPFLLHWDMVKVDPSDDSGKGRSCEAAGSQACAEAVEPQVAVEDGN